MRFALALALLGLVASASAQAVTQLIVPSSTPPAGCANSRATSFDLEIVSANATGARTRAVRRARHLVPRQNGDLHLTLTGGILTDSFQRKGYIASNYQFQFDKPPQAGAIYTAGWTICANGSLALGGQAVFWQCLSGSFYNLYDRDWAPAHCYPVYFQSIEGVGATYSTAPPAPESTGSDQATIMNAGGTQSVNMTSTAVGIGIGAASSTTTAASGSGGGSGSGSGSGGAKATGATSSGGAAAAVRATDAAQAMLAWAMGLAGAIALV